MKKLFMSLAILAAVVSCSKNEIAEVTTPNVNPIGFSTLNDKVTRVANGDKQNYAVYAQFSTATAGWYITGENITGNQTPIGDEITNGNKYYWPETPLNFYAYAPIVSNNITLNAAAPAAALGTLPITYTVPTTADEDFTVAKPVLDQKSDTNAGQVAFVFAHMLSKVNIKATLAAKLTADGYALELGDAVLDVNKNVGVVEVTSADPALSIDGAAATYTKPATDVTYLILPQSTKGCVVTITNAVIKKTGYLDIPVTLTYTFTDADVKLATFEAGKQYNLNFVVTLNEIMFASSVAAWDTEAGTDVPLN